MLAYVFWHRPAEDVAREDYEQRLRAFHATLDLALVTSAATVARKRHSAMTPWIWGGGMTLAVVTGATLLGLHFQGQAVDGHHPRCMAVKTQRERPGTCRVGEAQAQALVALDRQLEDGCAVHRRMGIEVVVAGVNGAVRG